MDIIKNGDINQLTFYALELKIQQVFKWIKDSLLQHNKSDSLKKEAISCLENIDKIISQKWAFIFEKFQHETILCFPEYCITLNQLLPRAQIYLNYFLENVATKNHYQIKALTLSAQISNIEAHKKENGFNEKQKHLNQALKYIERATQIIEDSMKQKGGGKAQVQVQDCKYQFMIFNLSNIIYDILRDFFREENMELFQVMISKIYQLMEQYLEGSQFWKQEFTWIYFATTFYSIKDPKKKQETLIELEKLWNKLPNQSKSSAQILFKETLFKQRIYFSLDYDVNKIKNQFTDKDEKFKFLFQLQLMKNGKFQKSVEQEINAFLIEINKNQGKQKFEEAQLNQEFSDIYAEIARIAIRYGIRHLADQLLQALKVLSRKSKKCLFLIELARAELMILNLQNDDVNNLQKLSPGQIKEINIKNRKEAIDIVCNALRIFKNLSDPQVYYEACIQVWNMCLPFLNSQYDYFLEKAFEEASKVLEMIYCMDYELRINFQYELARMYSQQNKLKESMKIAKKGLELSNFTKVYGQQQLYDILMDIQLQLCQLDQEFSIQFHDQKDLFQQLFHLKTKFNFLIKKQSIKIKKSDLEEIFQKLIEINQEEKQEDEISIKNTYISSKRTFKRLQKQLAFEIFQLAFNEKFHLFCNKIGKFLLQVDPELEGDLVVEIKEEIIDQKKSKVESIEPQQLKKKCESSNIRWIRTHFILIQNKINYLQENNQHFAFQEEEKIKPNLDSIGMELRDSNEILKMKSEIFEHFEQALQKSIILQQKWLIFNVGIIMWNNFLPIFKNSSNDSKLHFQTEQLLQKLVKCFMEIINDENTKNLVNYDSDKQIQIYGNIGIIYCRLLENKKEFIEVKNICEGLLQSNISQQMRKIVNSIIARMDTKMLKNNQSINSQKKELILDQRNQKQHEIIFKIEMIQNHSNPQEISNELQNVFKMMIQFIQSSGNEIAMSILVELWTQIANLALIQNTFQMTVFTIKCLEQINLLKEKNKNVQKSSQELKWLSYADYLYGKASYMIAQIEGIEFQEQYCLLFQSLKYFIKCNSKAIKSQNTKIIFQSIERFFLITKLIYNKYLDQNSISLLPKSIYTLLYQIKQANLIIDEQNLSEKYSQMYINILNIMYNGTKENLEWQQLNEACDFVLDYINVEYRKEVWFVKIKAISQLNTDEEQLMNQIREFEGVIQAQYLLQIANSSPNIKFQYFALKKAIFILKNEKKQEIVEALIDLSYWLYQQKIQKNKIFNNLFKAVDIIYRVDKGFNPDAVSQTLVQDNYYVPFSFQVRNKKVFLTYMQRELISKDIQKLDQLFRIHQFSSVLCQIKEHQTLFMKDSFYFIYSIMKINHENISNMNLEVIYQDGNDSVNEEKEKFQQKFPENIEEWFDYTLNSTEIKICQLDHDKCLINKRAFEKPLVTLDNLFKCIKYFYDQRIFYECLVMIQMLENYEKIVFDTNKLKFYCIILKYSIAKVLNLKIDKYQELINTNDWKQYFQNFHTMNQSIVIQNHQLKQFEEQNTTMVFATQFYEWETWLEISKICFNSCLYDLSQEFAQNYLRIVQQNNFKKEEKRTLLLISILNFHKGFSTLSLNTFKSLIREISEYDDFKIMIEGIFRYFQNRLDYLQCYEILTKIEQVLIQYFDQNSEDMINHSNKKDLLALIKLYQCQSNLFEFEQFQMRFMIESEKNYFNNFKFIYKLVLKNFQDFFTLSHQNINFNLITTFIETLFYCYSQLIQIKILNKPILNYIYLVYNVLIQNINSYRNQIANHLQKIEKHQYFDPKISPHFKQNSLIYQKIKELDLYWCKFMNFKNTFVLSFPYIDQKKFESQIFEEENFLQNNNESSKQEEILKQYLNDNQKQSIEFLQLGKLKTVLQQIELKDLSFKTEEIDLEREIVNLHYNLQQDSEEEINLNTANILLDLDKDQNQNQIELQIQQNKMKIKQAFIENLSNIKSNLKNWFSFEYFQFQKRRIVEILRMQNELQLELNLEDLLAYQNFCTQEYFLKYICLSTNKFTINDIKLGQFLENKKSEYDENNLIYQRLYSEEPIDSYLQKCPSNCFYIVFQHESNFQQIMICLFYVNEQNKHECIYKEYEDAFEINNEIKSFYRKSFEESLELDKNNDDEKENDQSFKVDDKKTFLFFKDIFDQTPKNAILKKMDKINELINNHISVIQEQNLTGNKKAQQTETTFNGLYFLLDHNYLDYPFESMIQEQIRKKMKGIFKNFSIQQVCLNLQKTIIDKKQCISIMNPQVVNFEEIKSPIDQLKNLFPDLMEKSEKQLLTNTEWDNLFQNSQFLVFQANCDLFKFYDPIHYFNNMQKIETKVIFCFDRMKIYDKEYLKYIHRRALEVNYLRNKKFFTLFCLSGMTFAAFPRYHFSSKDNLYMIEIIRSILNKDQEKLQELLLNDQQMNFSFYGNPFNLMESVQKKNK